MYGDQTRNVIGFPDQLVSDAEKASIEYTSCRKSYRVRMVQKSGTSRFYNNRDTYHKLRTYAMGEQSVQKYKDELAINGDISYLNLDWTIRSCDT